MKKFIAFSFVLLLLFGCSKPKNPDVTRLQNWHTEFLKMEKQLGLLSWYEIAENRYLNRLQVLEYYPMYGNTDSLNWLMEIKKQPIALPQYYLKMLETYQLQGLVKRATIDGLEKIAQLQNSDFVLPGRGNVFYRQISRHVQKASANESLRLFESAYPTALGILTLKNMIFQNLHNLENRIPFSSLDELLNQAYRFDKSNLVPADSFLQATQGKYDRLYQQLFWDGRNSVYATDLHKLYAAVNRPDYDKILSSDVIGQGLETFWRNLGIRIKRQSALQIVDSLASEQPPVVINLAIPDDVRIVFTTQPGLEALLQNFTTLAIAEQNVFKQTQDPLGAYIENPLTSIIAGGLTRTLTNPQILQETFEIDSLNAAEIAQRIDFYLLWNARNVVIARELIDSPDAEIQVNSFANRLQTYQHMELTTEQAAWLLAGLPAAPQIHFSAISNTFADKFLESLEKRFGAQWYRSVEAGKWLKELWENAPELQISDLIEDLHR